jgi:hypothetical protein
MCELSSSPVSIPENLQKTFLLAGNSKVIFFNSNTGNKLIYKIKQSKENVKLYFVKAFIDNEFKYMGIIWDGAFSITSKSTFTSESIHYKGFDYVFKKVAAGLTLNPVIQIMHSGKCGRCAKELTDPISIETGFGETCFKKITGKTFALYKLEKAVSKKFDQWAGQAGNVA